MQPGRRLVPARHRSTAAADAQRRELRLAAAHPVLVLDARHRIDRRGAPGRSRAAAAATSGVGVFASMREQRRERDARSRSADRCATEARAGLEQRFAERLGDRGLELERDREPGHYFFFFCSCASFCSR